MARWLDGLNQVSNLLEKLDDRVENVAEERAIELDDDGNDDGRTALVDDILSKRGISVVDGNGEEELNHQIEKDCGDGTAECENDSDHRADENDNGGGQSTACAKDARREDEQSEPYSIKSIAASSRDDGRREGKDAQHSRPRSSVERGNSATPKQQVDMTMAAKEAQKEVRVLRRHVVKLNSTLEQAESEISALRGELARAGERMEKDRTRAKELKVANQKSHMEEMNAIKKQHSNALADQKKIYEEKLEGLNEKLSALESQRRQEGGDWNKEISQAFEREQEIGHRMALLE